MSNDKHPDHHFDDGLIAQLYDTSKEKMQPSTHLDDLILSKLNGSAGDERVDVDGSSEKKVVSLTLAKEDANRTSKNASKKKRWFVPNSLVACLVVSVMVGLIYRENADQLLISDPMELDYAMPMSSAFDEAESSSGEDRETQGGRALMNSVSPLLELTPEKQSKARSKVQGVDASMSSAVVESTAITESEKMASHKAKKSKPKPVVKREEKARTLMMAPPAYQQKEVQEEDGVEEELQDNTLSFDVNFSQIRTLRDAGDVKGAAVLLDALLAEHPSLELPDDILLLKQKL